MLVVNNFINARFAYRLAGSERVARRSTLLGAIRLHAARLGREVPCSKITSGTSQSLLDRNQLGTRPARHRVRAEDRRARERASTTMADESTPPKALRVRLRVRSFEAFDHFGFHCGFIAGAQTKCHQISRLRNPQLRVYPLRVKDWKTRNPYGCRTSVDCVFLRLSLRVLRRGRPGNRSPEPLNVPSGSRSVRSFLPACCVSSNVSSSGPSCKTCASGAKFSRCGRSIQCEKEASPP